MNAYQQNGTLNKKEEMKMFASTFPGRNTWATKAS
jgi:hypothetical protein